MKLDIKLFLALYFLSCCSIMAQEMISDRSKSTEIIVNNNQEIKSKRDKKSVILQAIAIDPTKEQIAEKTKKAIILDSFNSNRVKKNRKNVYLIEKPIGDTLGKVQKSIQIVDGSQETKKENRVELKAILIPSED